MGNESKLKCLECDWVAPVDDGKPPINASQAAIDHYLVFGHAIERTDMAGRRLYEDPI